MEEYYGRQLDCLCGSVRQADKKAMDAARRRLDGIAKPIGGLGRFEDLLIKIAGIRGAEDMALSRKAVVVFCPDTGVVAEGQRQPHGGGGGRGRAAGRYRRGGRA